MPAPGFAPPDAHFTRPFWDGIAAKQLRLPRCSACHAWQWYPLPGTDHCPRAPVDWTPVRPLGSIFTFTVVRRPFLPATTKSDVPLTTVIIELDDAPGIRLVGRLADNVDARIDMRVTGEFVHDAERLDLRFKPIDG